MIDFYATIRYGHTRQYMPKDVHWLLPASSWARGKLCKPSLPNGLSTAADSGGFVATKIWGDYRYTPQQYFDWLCKFNPMWAATMDYCCEQEITGKNDGVVRERQQRTTDMAHLFWRDYRDTPWSWTPTIQGWEVEDYRRHANDLKPLLQEMQAHYTDLGKSFRVGIGTLCNRAKTDMILSVIHAVSDVLPGFSFHLWGVKLGVLKANLYLPHVISVDSAAWSPGGMKQAGLEARKERIKMGISEAKYDLTVALPRYLSKVEAALAKPKQMKLGM